jgi:hypothetical protein
MKQFYIKFNTGDWLTDAKLGMCTPLTRGIWIDILAVMSKDGSKGVIQGTYEQLARLFRCNCNELKHAIMELNATSTAEINEHTNGIVTVCNRRMQKEYRERLATNERVKKHRSNEKETPKETPKQRKDAGEGNKKATDTIIIDRVIDKKEECNKEKNSTHTQVPFREYPKTWKEVQQQAELIGYAIPQADAENFIAKWQAKNWMDGKTPIMDWTKLLVTWKNSPRREGSKTAPEHKPLIFGGKVVS